MTLPVEYADELEIAEQDFVYLGPNPDWPGTLVLIPEGVMGEIFERGWDAVHP